MSLSSSARVLIVGSGGREHALGVALARSPMVASVTFAGGENAGLERMAHRIALDDVPGCAKDFDLVVIGPEAPLVAGLADTVRKIGVPVFGPSAAAARLEASKAFTKAICEDASIPTAKATVCDTRAHALEVLERIGAPIVVKADGLAAGKGVVVAETPAEAIDAVEACFSGGFGAAGAKVVLEEKLSGPELSLFALSDGNTVRLLATARDYKRAFDNDAGPNTGGMGAVSPAPDVGREVIDDAMARIVRPAIEALKARGTPYVGVLYAGLMLTAEGPKLIEFNVRFGDPECQAILPRLAVDAYALLHATATGALTGAALELSPEVAVAVVVAAGDYPGEVVRGEPIGGLEAVQLAGALVYHAGTRQQNGTVVSNGGRVLAAVSIAPTAAQARTKVYGALGHLDWPGGRMRRDIAN